MNNKKYAIIILVTSLFSFLGGMFGQLIFANSQANAEGKLEQEFNIIKAKEIYIVNKDNEKKVALYLGAHDAPNLVFFDKNGVNKLNLGIAPAGNAGIEIIGTNGNKWKAP